MDGLASTVSALSGEQRQLAWQALIPAPTLPTLLLFSILTSQLLSRYEALIFEWSFVSVDQVQQP